MARAQTKLDEARQSAERAVAEGRKAARSSVEAGREQVDELREAATEGYGKALRAVESRYEDTRKSLTSVAGDIGGYVREHPAASISLAWSCGLCAGLLLRRRRRG